MIAAQRQGNHLREGDSRRSCGLASPFASHPCCPIGFVWPGSLAPRASRARALAAPGEEGRRGSLASSPQGAPRKGAAQRSSIAVKKIRSILVSLGIVAVVVAATVFAFGVHVSSASAAAGGSEVFHGKVMKPRPAAGKAPAVTS